MPSVQGYHGAEGGNVASLSEMHLRVHIFSFHYVLITNYVPNVGS